ncbi:MAG: PAS domain S-box protein [Gammaproteobacteria bacterium]
MGSDSETAGLPRPPSTVAQSVTDARSAPSDAQRLRTVFEANQIGVWDWDIAHDTFERSAHMARMLGYAEEDLPDQAAWTALVHADDLPRVRHSLGEHLAGRRPDYEVELRLRARDGEWRWVYARGQVTERRADGRALRMMGVHLDITARKRAEAALAASEARLRAVVDNVPVGIILADDHGAPVFTNDALRRILHLDDAEGLGLEWMAAMAPADRDEMLRLQGTLVAGESDAIHTEFHYQRAGHAPQRISARIQRVRAPQADFTFIGVGEDVTQERAQTVEHERLLRHLQQAQKMEAIGQLAGGIAHDFNNLLTAVVGFSKLALNRCGEDPGGKLADYLHAVIAAGERGRELVAKMLAFSRSEVHTSHGTVEPLTVAREVVTMLGGILPSSMRLTVFEAEPVPPVRMDAVDLHQALVNLVVNARDAVQQHGTITLAVGPESPANGHCASCHALLDGQLYVTVSVRDDGAGMASDLVGRIFDPFFTTKAVGQGTGMGLSVVHGVTHQHGGHVQVESTPGLGTEFRLLLQAGAQAGDVAVASPVVAPRAANFNGVRVLVVDDEPGVRAFVGEVLRDLGATVTSVEDGQAALALLRAGSQPFDLVFTDQTMPRMTGIELLTALRGAEDATPLILCSGYGDTARDKVEGDGRALFLTKPVNPDDILRAAARMLDR